ncbi:alpha/beta hydrolase [Sphingopyxis sp. PAMC25046]|uniref:alpha/beta hydrolase family protein n=1 Tax=Sphingopyxis sp. PAMC25046 TaxID=2565556 RepID=UPI00109DAB1C|nr:prolyl oligopeptidase family serine peptidase [Sphingopyxis sp. PAMC25046]QCB53758.1 alpha/beta hydrolase [Sphingopyxis sp. PAMC25046]
MPHQRLSSTLRACIVAVALAATSSAAHAAEGSECHVGSYRLADGRIVDIAPLEDDRLRWRSFDGAVGELKPQRDGGWQSLYGWIGRPDGIDVRFGACSAGTIRFAGSEGQRLTFDVAKSDFNGRDGVTLKGQLVMPKGTGKVPVVVLVHGAERDAALRFNFLQRLFPAVGIGVFVYDKRGTGTSGGTYTQDFDLLADDAIAAMATARKLAGARAGRVGYQGASQGGWVAPLAANRAPADFVIVSFGLAVSILDEDLQQMEMELTDKGYPPEIIAKAQEIARAAGEIFASNFKDGYAEFDAVRAKYRSESWYKDVHGHITWLLLPHEEAAMRAEGPNYDWGTPFRYDPMPTLTANRTPQLWVLGGRDYQAPAKETSRRLGTLIDAGKPFSLAVYPQAEHGITLFETAPDGTRTSTRFAEGYFAMMRDFIKEGAIDNAYGDARISGASVHD